MLDLELINTTISELEDDDTNFDICRKLADLYVIRDHINVTSSNSDVLPHYNNYCNMKKQYQLGDTTIELVESQFFLLCNELTELIQLLYSTSDTQAERDMLKSIWDTLKTHC